MARFSTNIEDYPKLNEASYLVAHTNTSLYRIVLRYFFVEHERMRDFLYPEQILEHVRTIHGLENYSEDELQRDLSQLVAWKNISPMQDATIPRTISEFKRNTFRYQITPYTVQIERMLETLRIKGSEFSGSLDKRPFELLLLSLRSFLEAEEDLMVLEYWNRVIELFTKIRENTADYLAYISNANAEEKMQNESFFAYKDGFTKYLRDFVVGSPQNAMKIRRVFETQNAQQLKMQFKRIAQHQDDVPRFENITVDETTFIEELLEMWASVGNWFIGHEGRPAEYDILQVRTDEAIRTIARTIKRIGERSQSRISRKRDYLHVATWFDRAETIEEAHRISSVVFGVNKSRNLQIPISSSRDIYKDAWLCEPHSLITKPVSLYYKEKRKTRAYRVDDEARRIVAENYRLSLIKTKQELDIYFVDSVFSLSDAMMIPKKIRTILLAWISRGMMSEDKQIVSEYGYRVRVDVTENTKIKICSEDGFLEMPAVKFTRVEEGKFQ